jgi:HEAT repeat protein
LGQTQTNPRKNTLPVSDPLQSHDWQVRLKAVQALAHDDSPTTRQTLLTMLADKDEDVRSSARSALLLQGNAVKDDLIDVLHHGENHDARSEAAIALRAFVCEDILDALGIASQDDSRFVRFSVAETLAHCRDKRAHEILKVMLDDDDPYVRAVAQGVFGEG